MGGDVKAIVLLALTPCVLSAQLPVGCFDTTLGPWVAVEASYTNGLGRSPPPDQSPDSVGAIIPSRLRLDDAPFARSTRDAKLVSVPANVLQVPHPFRFWRHEGDSLFLTFSNRYSGTNSTLGASDGRWRGLARTFTDVGGSLVYERPIVLEPVDCQTPPREPASLDPNLRRGIDLADGVELVLGRPLPSGVRLEPRRSGAFTALVQAAGVWAGHDTVVVRVDSDDIVHHIELRYPVGFDLSDALYSLSSVQAPNRDQGTQARWINRTTRITLSLGRRPRLVFLDPRYF